MADNVNVSPGSGAVIAADDISNVYYQRVKIAHGADGSATDVSTASPLPTNSTGITITVAPTVTAGAYSAKDAVGGLMTFASAVRAAGGKSIIRSLVLTDLGVTANVLTLFLFKSTPTPINDNAAFDIPDAELPLCIGAIPIAAGDYIVATDNQVATVRNIGLEIECTATSLFGQLMCTGTPTYASTADLTVTLGIEYLT